MLLLFQNSWYKGSETFEMICQLIVILPGKFFETGMNQLKSFDAIPALSIKTTIV